MSPSHLVPTRTSSGIAAALCQYNILHSWAGSWTGRSWERTLTAQQKNCCSLRNAGEVSQPTAAQTHFPAEPTGECSAGVGMISGVQVEMGTFFPGADPTAFVPWNSAQLEMQLQRLLQRLSAAQGEASHPPLPLLNPLLALHLTPSYVHSQQLSVDPLWPDRIH